MTEPTDVQRLGQQLRARAGAEKHRALVGTLRSERMASIFEDSQADPEPTLHPIPSDVRGFRVRLDLHGAKPPVWRRLELPGDLTLPRLHDVIQVSMGWSDSHLHRFRTSRYRGSPYFITHLDLDDGEGGLLEDRVRIDQLLAEKGDELWYEYDFGDCWDHRLVVEAVLGEPPASIRCIAGRLACPPEDCGGLGGFDDLAVWVRSGYDEASLSDAFESVAYAHDRVDADWHPDHFDLEQINAALGLTVAEPVAVISELAELAEQLDRRGNRQLHDMLGRALSHGPTDVSESEAARVTATYRIFLDVIGDGATLTTAGYLPPAVVEQFAELSGITGWWIGKANREDLTPPVAAVRDTARALGLVGVRKGRLAPTAAATRCREDPLALWRHIVGRLPLGTKDAERQAGWLALAAAASGAPAQKWRSEVGGLLFTLGWRGGRDPLTPPPADSLTLDVLDQLAGWSRSGRRISGTDLAVAATARAVVRLTRAT